jgi:hypothetical protein
MPCRMLIVPKGPSLEEFYWNADIYNKLVFGVLVVIVVIQLVRASIIGFITAFCKP